MNHHRGVNRGALHNGAVRSQIALQNSNAAFLHKGIRDRTDHFIIQDFMALDVFADRLSGHCHAVKIQMAEFCELMHDSRDTARAVQIHHGVFASR